MYQLILTFFHHHQDNKESTLLISSYSHFIRKCTYKRCDTCDTLEKGTPNKEGTLAVQESSYHYPLKIWRASLHVFDGTGRTLGTLMTH